MSAPRRCVLLFSRNPGVEARAKCLPGAMPLFAAVRSRLLEAVSRSGAELMEPRQRGVTFGDRLANAFEDARARGYTRIVVVPGDVPGLCGPILLEAFRRLDEATVVLGPSPDGGVYLIGCRGSLGGLLTGVRWRTGDVLGDLLMRAPKAALLPSLKDLDRRSDLKALKRDPSAVEELRSLAGDALGLADKKRSTLEEQLGSFPPKEGPDLVRGPPPL